LRKRRYQVVALKIIMLVVSGVVAGAGWYGLLSRDGRSGRGDPHGVAAAGAAVLALAGTGALLWLLISGIDILDIVLNILNPTAELTFELGRLSYQ